MFNIEVTESNEDGDTPRFDLEQERNFEDSQGLSLMKSYSCSSKYFDSASKS